MSGPPTIMEGAMLMKKETADARKGAPRDPFNLLREMTADLDRVFEDTTWPTFRWPFLRSKPLFEAAAFTPAIDVFEKDNRLITRVDLPGLKKEEVKVELADGYLAISGERKSEVEDKKDDFYRCERSYGSFYRAVPLPEGIKFEDVKATFVDGVLEVSVPVPAKQKAELRTVAIEGGTQPVKAA
jgi:HSP20 family protein